MKSTRLIELIHRVSRVTSLGLVVALGFSGLPAPAQRQAPTPSELGQRTSSGGFLLGPQTTAAVVEEATATIPNTIPNGPIKPEWDSLKANYVMPGWVREAKFGIFMHWGIFSVPAFGGGGASEWYQKHLYDGSVATVGWHTEHYGPPEKFGYKDFIPLFTAAKWDPAAWALLFKKAGAKFVVPTAQHCDNFSNWDSRANPYNAKAMGPHRDLIGDLAKAVRAQGLKFGVSNHNIEAWEWVRPKGELEQRLRAAHADVYSPEWAGFYLAADQSEDALKKFLVNWAQRNVELIDQYQPDMLWFDNGIQHRVFDPLKLWIAAYYYNRAATWKKEVTIAAKGCAYAPDGDNIQTIGALVDFERINVRSPAGIRTGAWLLDDPIGVGPHWGYADGMTINSAAGIVGKLVDTVSQNGTYLLNISPKADGTIPQDQQDSLLGVGEWLGVNGEAIYGTHNWSKFQDSAPDGTRPGHIRYTVKADTLYAIYVGDWLGAAGINLTALANSQPLDGAIKSVALLGCPGDLKFTQDSSGLHVTLPTAPPCKIAYALKITGLKMNADTFTRDGNPLPAFAAPVTAAVPFERVQIADRFWSPRIRQMQEVTLPLLLDLAEQQGRLANFRIVAGRATGKLRPTNAADSDVYKLIEAAAYSLATRRDAALERRLDAMIDDIAAAQQPDGYLNTQFTLPLGHPAAPSADNPFIKKFGFGPEGRWASRAGNWVKDYSQMYCAGHLFESAVAYARATGKRAFLEAAIRLADHMVQRFPIDRPLDQADHPEVEIGLMKLYEFTGNASYLRLADYIAREISFARPPDLGEGANRKPLADQRVAWGHAVRTAYLFTGATDIVRHTGAADLRTAVLSLWESIAGSRLYIHGGVGGPSQSEQLQPPWLLDPAQTYSECCANIAQGQWAHSLNLLTGEGRYADLVELESYNAALSGLSADGEKFFYSNLLAAGTAVRKNPHSGVRQTYLFCCPSKVPGFVSGVGRWVAAESAETITLNQYIGGTVRARLARGREVELAVTSALPWEGNATVSVVALDGAGTFTLALRIPGWARNQPVPGGIYRYTDAEPEAWALAVDGQAVAAKPDALGYVRLTREWRLGTRVTLQFPMTPRRVVADSRATLLAGRVAVMRGPLLYCLEETDNAGTAVTRAELPRAAVLAAEFRPDLLGGVTVITATVSGKPPLTLVPYFAWQNRGIGEMNTWPVEDTARAVPLNLPAAEVRVNTNG